MENELVVGHQLLSALSLTPNYQLSLGDARSYLLTTAENELGVVLAQSEAGKCWPITIKPKQGLM